MLCYGFTYEVIGKLAAPGVCTGVLKIDDNEIFLLGGSGVLLRREDVRAQDWLQTWRLASWRWWLRLRFSGHDVAVLGLKAIVVSQETSTLDHICWRGSHTSLWQKINFFLMPASPPYLFSNHSLYLTSTTVLTFSQLVTSNHLFVSAHPSCLSKTFMMLDPRETHLFQFFHRPAPASLSELRRGIWS